MLRKEMTCLCTLPAGVKCPCLQKMGPGPSQADIACLSVWFSGMHEQLLHPRGVHSCVVTLSRVTLTLGTATWAADYRCTLSRPAVETATQTQVHVHVDTACLVQCIPPYNRLWRLLCFLHVHVGT